MYEIFEHPSKAVSRVKNRAGRCYELCAKAALSTDGWTLVHGEIYGWIGHAWLQRGDTVYDAVRDCEMAFSDYEATFSARVLRTYTKKEAAREAAANKFWGPWMPAEQQADSDSWRARFQLRKRTRTRLKSPA